MMEQMDTSTPTPLNKNSSPPKDKDTMLQATIEVLLHMTPRDKHTGSDALHSSSTKAQYRFATRTPELVRHDSAKRATRGRYRPQHEMLHGVCRGIYRSKAPPSHEQTTLLFPLPDKIKTSQLSKNDGSESASIPFEAPPPPPALAPSSSSHQLDSALLLAVAPPPLPAASGSASGSADHHLSSAAFFLAFASSSSALCCWYAPPPNVPPLPPSPAPPCWRRAAASDFWSRSDSQRLASLRSDL